jgi:succinate dehydrogenase flavin-adding protein (antitoxin of CptAB toxin-antitoxin module)
MIEQIKQLAKRGKRECDLHILINCTTNCRTSILEETDELEQMLIIQDLEAWIEYIESQFETKTSNFTEYYLTSDL